ncbi:MAG TPA: zf-HC2 domain-containing protein [Actinomycetes bacterium]|nr:zf-HC2 domain-containing protein [Actinomycetes bacterium]
MTCSFAHDDAAYVLGALSTQERRAYEEHLSTCAECSRAVQDIAGLPGLLAKTPMPDLTAEPASEAPELPESLLPSLLVQASRDRRRRWWVGAVVGAAAACVLAFSVIAGTSVLGDGSTTLGPTAGASSAAAEVLTLTPVGEAPIQATAQLVDQPWGTRIDVKCTYVDSYRTNAASYTLVVIDHSGVVQQVSTWKSLPRVESQVMGTSSWARGDIAALEIRTNSGTPVMRLET